MPLRVAVQMDPIEGINISGDSTFAIMLGAQARGHTLYHYLADALTYEGGRLYAGAHPIRVQQTPGDHYSLFLSGSGSAPVLQGQLSGTDPVGR